MSKEKLTPRLRFEKFEHSSTWNEIKIGELSNIVRGASPRPIQDPKWFDNKSDVGWLRISDVTNQDGRIYYLEQKISVAGQKKTRVLREPHLLLSIAATVGKPVINYVATGVHDGFLIFKDPIFELEFMYQWFEMFRPTWKQYGQPGSQVNLNSSLVRNKIINIPSSEEQREISDFFKKIDQMIQLQQSKVNKVKDIKSAYLSEIFPKEGEKYPKKRFEGFTEPWNKNKLDTLANNYDTYRIPVTASDRIPGNTPYYGANGIQDYVEGYTHDGEYILLAEDGANDLKNYPVHYVNGKVWVNNHAHVLQGNPEVLDNRFLMYKLKTIDMEPYLVGGGRAKLNANVMMNIELVLPNLEEQIKIGSFFKNLDNQISIEKEKLAKLEKLKQAYLNDMFV